MVATRPLWPPDSGPRVGGTCLERRESFRAAEGLKPSRADILGAQPAVRWPALKLFCLIEPISPSFAGEARTQRAVHLHYVLRPRLQKLQLRQSIGNLPCLSGVEFQRTRRAAGRIFLRILRWVFHECS